MRKKLSELKLNKNRRTIHSVVDLTYSMNKVGQLHPIIINKRGEVICGYRRVLAARELGWKEIEAVEVDAPLEIVQHDENVRRQDLHWSELISLRALIHLKLAYGKRAEKLSDDELWELFEKGEAPAWTLTNTSECLGIDKGTLSKSFQAARLLRADPSLATLPSYRSLVEERSPSATLEQELRRLCNRYGAQEVWDTLTRVVGAGAGKS